MPTFVAAVAVNNGITATTTDATVSLSGTGAAAGDLLLVFLDNENSSNTITVGPSTIRTDTNGTSQATWIVGALLASADITAGSVTITFGTAARISGDAHVWRGAAVPTSARTAVNVESTATGSPVLPSLTGVTAGSSVLAGFLRRRSGAASTTTVPAAYTSPTNNHSGTAFASGINTFLDTGYVVSSAGGTVGGETGSTPVTAIGINYVVEVLASSSSTAATSTGTVSLGGTASASAPTSATGTVTLGGSGTGGGVDTATGAVGLSGTANATFTATGTVTFAGTASGVASASATATGTVSVSGNMTATVTVAATGVLSVGGVATPTQAILPPPVLPAGLPTRTASVLIHVGSTLTGRINATIPVTAATWSATLNDSGSVTATVASEIVNRYDLRNITQGDRAFLAFERDGRIKQAGPVRSRSWDWEKGELTLGAVGLWGYLDKRIISPVGAVAPYAKDSFTVTGKSLGGLARAIVDNSGQSRSPAVPIVLPPDETGAVSKTYPLYALMSVGDQLRQITQQATDAPDIAFVPRRTAADPRFVEWVMRVGTASQPALTQNGPDWIFDTSAPKSPVFGIATDEDSTSMAQFVWVTGNGQEQAILMSLSVDANLLAVALGWPIMESTASYPTIDIQADLDSLSANLLQQRARPIETYKATVATEAVAQVEPGDYCRVITRGDVWLGDMDREMRIKTISGDLTDKVALDMYPMAAAL